MAPSSRTFRIFVSSTFDDLKEERNALQERVFPRLRDLCMRRGFRFQAIDLRWGISEEAALDQQTVRICLEEIARCQKTTLRPNFIVLLGDRYGWRPLPAEIPASEFEEIERRIPDPADRELLSAWYRRDDNAVPPEYRLQPRTGEFENLSVWEERVERPLHSVLQRAAAGMPLPAGARLKYLASATEQEIVHGALNTEDAQEHVYCFFRSFLAASEDGSVGIEREDGSVCPVGDVIREKEIRNFLGIGPDGEFDHASFAQLRDLKERLRNRLPGNIVEYRARWTGTGVTPNHLDKLCDDTYESLSREILKQTEQFETTDPLDQENRAHEDFGKDRARVFVGRAEYLDRIREYIKAGSRHPLAIHGESGSGKSALMAQAAWEARENHPEAEVIARFIGTTPASSDGRSLLENLCRQIHKVFNLEEQKRQKLTGIKGNDEETRDRINSIEQEYSIPSDYQKLAGTFRDFLGKGPDNIKLILFLDALDQLSNADNARGLFWLPDKLPDNVRIVVSTLAGECLTALERKLPPTCFAELKPMPPDEGADLLDRWLGSAGRTLQPAQRKDVLDKFSQCGMPLYLKLAFEEARRWKSYDGLPTGSDDRPGLREDVPGIINDLFLRLSRESNHGATMVSRGLGYLAAAKNGLTEDELIAVLSDDQDVMKDFHERSPRSLPVASLPVVIWSRLYFDLEPYLTERQADGTTLISFYHRQFGEEVVKKYLGEDVKAGRHKRLAGYFGGQPLRMETDGKKAPNLRKLSELPFQQAHGGMANDLRNTLTDFDFMYAKVSAVGPQPMIEDYDLANIQALHRYQPLSDKNSVRVLSLIQGALRLSCHILAQDSSQLSSQLLARLSLSSSDEAEVKLLQRAKQGPGLTWLRPLTESLISPGGPLLRSINIHSSADLVAISPDGRLAVSVHASVSIYIWDLDSGKCRFRIDRCWINYPYRVIISPDSKYVVYPSRKTLGVINLNDGEHLIVKELHTSDVKAVGLGLNGNSVYSASSNGTIILWDLKSLISPKEVKESGKGIEDIAVTSSGNYLLSLASDGEIKLWDARSLTYLRSFKGSALRKSKDSARIAVTPDEKHVVSAANSGGIKLWNMKTGRCMRFIKSVQVKPFGTIPIALAPSAKPIVIAKCESNIEVWNLVKGDRIRVLEGYGDGVSDVAVTPDMHYAVTYRGPRLEVLDLKNEMYDGLPEVRGHISVALTPDGQKAVSLGEDAYLNLGVWYVNDHEIDSKEEWLGTEGRGKKAVAMTNDGQQVICASYEGPTGIIWDLIEDRWEKRWIPLLKNKTWFRNESGFAGKAFAVEFYRDGHKAVLASRGRLLIINVDSGTCIREIDGSLGVVNAVAVAPDAGRVIFGVSDIIDDFNFDSIGGLDVHDLESGECRKFLRGHGKHVSAVAVTPDGRLGISGSEDGTLTLWDLEAGEKIIILTGHTDQVGAVAITPDGSMVVSGSMDQTVKVWNIKRNCVVATFYGDSAITDCKIATDGLTCVAAEESGRVHLLRLENV